MAKNYVKVNPLVAEAIGVTKYRSKLPDGNYALWWSDLRHPALGSGSLFPDEVARTLRNIGGVELTGAQLRVEQNPPAGYVPLPLPEAEWAQYRMPRPSDGTHDPSTEGTDPEAVADTETPAGADAPAPGAEEEGGEP